MDLIFGILLGIIWIGGILMMRSVTTFFHEMGHALPALLFTKKERVRVFVGTYGDISNCLQLNFGRLILYLKLNVFNWRIGLCAHGDIKGLIPQLIVILGGPLASLLIASTALYFIITKDFGQIWVVFIAFFLISAIFDFIVNIDPSHTPIKMYDDTITYSDGYQIINAFKRQGMPADFFIAEKLYHEKNYDAAIEKCENLIENTVQKKPVYDLIINSLIAKKEYSSALKFYDYFKGIHKYAYTDFYQLGWLNLQIDRWEEALPYFDHCIYEKHDDGAALTNRGYIHLQRGNYERARQDLEAAVAYTPDNPMAWSNRGLLKVKTKEPEAGFNDLQIALKLDPENPKVSYHLGLYFEEERKYEQALDYYKKAKTLGLTYHGIDLRIAEMESFIDAFS